MSDKDFSIRINNGSAEPGEQVTITVDLKNNPGFCGFVIDLRYDGNAMKLVKAEAGKDFAEITEAEVEIAKR